MQILHETALAALECCRWLSFLSAIDCRNDWNRSCHAIHLTGENISRFYKPPWNAGGHNVVAIFIYFQQLRPSTNVLLLPCWTQTNLARQCHDKRTAVVSNVDFSGAEGRKKFALLKTILNGLLESNDSWCSRTRRLKSSAARQDLPC